MQHNSIRFLPKDVAVSLITANLRYIEYGKFIKIECIIYL